MSKRNHKQGINAAAWFSQQSFAGRIEEPRPEPKQSATMVIDRWIDGRWVSVEVPNPALGGGK